MQNQFERKTVVITGACGGMGRAFATAFGRRGAKVGLLDLDQTSLLSFSEELTSEDIEVAWAVCDVMDREACEAAIDSLSEQLGRIDILINNAGMSPLYKSLTDVSQDLFDKVMNVNLRGPFRLSALFGQQMFNDGNGSIINVSSIAAAQPSPHEVPYGAAKAGLHSLTKSFSRAYAPHVRVNCIMPGPFLTDISDAWSDATHESLKHLPLGRGGQPDEVVGAALYFASEASSYTTGAVLKIDGGSIASTS